MAEVVIGDPEAANPLDAPIKLTPIRSPQPHRPNCYVAGVLKKYRDVRELVFWQVF